MSKSNKPIVIGWKHIFLFEFCCFIVALIFSSITVLISPIIGKSRLESVGDMILLCSICCVIYMGLTGAIFVVAWIYGKYVIDSGLPRLDPNEIIHDATPDKPVSFGRKCMWIAVKSSDTEKIADVLALQKREPCNWKAGVENGYIAAVGTPVFLTPPVDGWSFLIGETSLPNPETDCEELVELLNRLSRDFDEACYFGTMRTSEFAAWFRSQSGKMVRKFLFIGDTPYNEGERLGIEADVEYIGSDIDERDDKTKARAVWPDDEDWVMQIAADWSLDPTKLHRRKKTPKAVGILGYLPKVK